jgi:hypothetical protein
MKQIYTITLTLLIALSGFAGTTITALKNGKWSTKGTWDLNRVPTNGDIVVIPNGITVKLDNSIKLDNLLVDISGSLIFDNGKLHLDENSRVVIEATGMLEGDNANDQIKIGNVLKYNGKEGPIYGTRYADAITGKSPNGFIFGALPVRFLSFNVTMKGGQAILEWSTANEQDNNRFEIEKSNDGNHYSSIGTVKAAGNASATQHYQFTDANAGAVNYYRIRQVDDNGQYAYSAIRMVKAAEAANSARIYAAGSQSIQINFNAPLSENVKVNVLNLNGQIIASRNCTAQTSQLAIALNNPKGLQIVEVLSASGSRQVQKILF